MFGSAPPLMMAESYASVMDAAKSARKAFSSPRACTSSSRRMLNELCNAFGLSVCDANVPAALSFAADFDLNSGVWPAVRT